jgi:hypothetical protein
MEKIKNLGPQALVLLHCALYSIGLLGAIQTLSTILSRSLFTSVNAANHYSEWAVPTVSKPIELVQYALSLVALFAYYIIVFAYRHKFSLLIADLKKITVSSSKLGLYLAGSIFLNLMMWRSKHDLAPLIMIVWLFCFFSPSLSAFKRSLRKVSMLSNAWQGWALTVVVLSLGFAVFPYVTGTFKISNDYFDIPEKTILDSGIVDNTDFINRHKIGGLNRHDPRLSEPVSTPENLEEDKHLTSEEMEFLKKNRRELYDQSLAGHYFHHQHTMLGTINEYMLGKPRDETIFLYGWLSTLTVATLITHVFGGFSFENYTQALYLFYPVYHLLLIGAAIILFRRRDYVLLVAAITIATFFKVGFEEIRFAPGFNPIRHLFDICTLVCMYSYFLRPNRKLIAFAAAILFASLGVLFNKEFGGALLLALIGTLGLKAIIERDIPWREFLLLSGAIAALYVLLTAFTTATNPTLAYVLLGVATPSFSRAKMVVLLMMIGAIYLFLGQSKDKKNGWTYLALLYFFYTQGLLIYYVWNPAPNHLWALGSIWGVLLVLLIRYGVSNYELIAKHERSILQYGSIAVLLLFFMPGLAVYCKEKYQYEKIFKNHVVHQWTIPHAGITTTMEAGVFENGVSLINKYADGNAIYILSRYDNFLPFLAGKYSAMPFQEVALSLVTQKEINKSVDVIKQNKPVYLFVDADIDRPHQGDVYDENDPATQYLKTYDASRGRALVLDTLAKVFNEIEPLYEPIERGQLITVYKMRAAR